MFSGLGGSELSSEGKISPGNINSSHTLSIVVKYFTSQYNLQSSQTEELALIVGPIVGGMAFIALVGLAIFFVMARRKRKGEGHYRPAKQELPPPRLQLDNMLKIPPEERLI